MAGVKAAEGGVGVSLVSFPVGGTTFVSGVTVTLGGAAKSATGTEGFAAVGAIAVTFAVFC